MHNWRISQFSLSRVRARSSAFSTHNGSFQVQLSQLFIQLNGWNFDQHSKKRQSCCCSFVQSFGVKHVYTILFSLSRFKHSTIDCLFSQHDSHTISPYSYGFSFSSPFILFFFVFAMCVYSKHTILAFLRFCVAACAQTQNPILQGLKRSVTTLRGGSLGYAEIVAVKVYTHCLAARAKNARKIDWVANEPQLPGVQSLSLCGINRCSRVALLSDFCCRSVFVLLFVWYLLLLPVFFICSLRGSGVFLGVWFYLFLLPPISTVFAAIVAVYILFDFTL